jgi:BirA family biotin operon repressor/biotin-[acetyl-CoA-carboxylase] ligase
LQMGRLGAKLLMFDVLESTMGTARELAEDGEPEGTVIAADMQKAGLGRLGRKWESPKGGVWFSIILRPDVPTCEAPKLTLMAGAAVARALGERYRLDARLKWPNDVLIDGKKVCGILTELKAADRIDHVLIGIGMNANFSVSALGAELRQASTTLRDELGKKVDANELLHVVLDEFEALYTPFCKGDHLSLHKEWKELSDTIGKKVKVETPAGTIQGVARDVSPTGALVVKTTNGDVEVLSGDCIYLR